ncbi:hypothetical protein ACOMHN_039870 [Nucella lapillus]
MAQVDVEVEGSKSALVDIYKERIESLFDVSINFQTSSCTTVCVDDHGNQLENKSLFRKNVVLQLSSQASQESVQKATIFLKAVLEESTDFTIERDRFSSTHFDMVLKASPTIQSQTLSVLDFDRNTREVCMKGQRNNVDAAKQHISHLIMGPQQNFPSAYQTNKQSPSSGGLVTQSTVSNRDSGMVPVKNSDLLTSHSRDVDNNVIVDTCHTDPMRSYSLTTDDDQEFPSICGSDLIDRGATMKSPIKSPMLIKSFAEAVSLKDSSSGGGSTDVGKSHSSNDGAESMSDHSSSALSDEDTGINVVDKSDARYESRLEFAVKLGYTERDLDKVIIRHGMGCNEDTLLHELIENSAGSVQPESDFGIALTPTIGGPPDLGLGDSDNVFLGVMKKVKSEDSGSNLRHIVVDGSNVAMSHGKNVFSCRGIQIAVDWFRQRGHQEITVFVPQWRKETSRPDTPITDQEILGELEKEGIVVFTPARRIKGRRVVCYDDRFVLKLAAETNGIVVSNDNYRDLLNENKEYRTVVDERLLMYTFVNDRFMPPEDPLGRRGPTLDNFLCKEPTSPPSLPPECPYGRKCTYGNKCKYHHPERGSQPHKTVTEVLKEQATIKMQERAVKGPEPIEKSRRSKPKLARTRSLAPMEGEVSGEKGMGALSPLPQSLQESDAEVRRKSPTRGTGKTADYLREHRKKLEEMLAISSAVDLASSKEQPGGVPPPPSSYLPVSSPSHLNVPPFSSSQEGQLVRGHLLLAKKLSDEASESSFFSNEISSNRASPVALAGPAAVSGLSQQELLSLSAAEKLYDRRASLQDHHRHAQYYPSAYVENRHLSQLGFQHAAGYGGGQCQSYPTSEKEGGGHSALRRLTSYCDQPHAAGAPPPGMGMEPSGHREHAPLKPLHSCPPGQFPPATPGPPFSSQPFGGMVRQNSSSDPQLHMTALNEAPFSPWHTPTSMPPPPPPPGSMQDSRGPRPIYGSSEHRGQGEGHHHQQQQQLYRSTSVQPFRSQRPYGSHSGLDRQISEVMLGSHNQGMAPAPAPAPTSSPYTSLAPWEMGGMYHSHPSTPTHHPHPSTPTHHPHPLSPAMPHGHGGAAMSPWPPQQMPPSPVKSLQQQQQAGRCFPASQPIQPSDPRYTLYYNLCGIFAEHRVRAVMNQYPDERDPQVLAASIVSEL